MAEIKIQEKKSSPWPWILGIILLALVGWIVYANMNKDNNSDAPAFDNDTTGTGMAEPDTSRSSAEQAVNSYIMFTETNDTIKQVEPVYVKEGLSRLQQALKAVLANENIKDSGVSAQTDSLEQFTKDFNETETKLSSNIRTAFISAAGILESIEQRGNKDIKTKSAELEKEAKSIDGRKSIAEQGDKIKRFFNEAGEVLRSVVPREA